MILGETGNIGEKRNVDMKGLHIRDLSILA